MSAASSSSSLAGFQQSFSRNWKALALGIVLATITLSVSLFLIEGDVHQVLHKQIEQQHEIVKTRLDEFKAREELFLNSLADNELVKAFSTDYQSEKNTLQALFNSLARSKDNVMQLRFFDMQGNELIRIDGERNSTSTKIIADENLQNKADRYYFQQFAQLSEGETGYSKFDLNVERGEVEVPFNPTLRMAKTVYIDGAKKGIVIVNFYMEGWISYLTRFSLTQVAMMDSQGYFLAHYDEDWAWSRYLKPAKTAKDFYGEGVETLLTDMKAEHFDENHGTYQAFFNFPLNLFGDQVMFIYEPKNSLETLVFERMMFFSLIVLLSLAFVVVPLIRIIRQNFSELYKLNESNQEISDYIQNIFDHTFEAILVVGDDGRISKANLAAKQLFGFSKSSLNGLHVCELIQNADESPLCSQTEELNSFYQAPETDQQLRLLGQTIEQQSFPILLAITHTRIHQQNYHIWTIQDMSKQLQLEKENSEQQAFIFQQAKLASMGEMLGAIAHQWRQPLNELSIRIQKLRFQFKKEGIDEAYVDEFVEKNKKTIHFMSHTIDDFKNFFRIDKVPQVFALEDSIKSALQILSAQLQSNHIDVHLESGDSKIKGLKSELQQVIINLVSNSVDAFVEHGALNKRQIDIRVEHGCIHYQDYAGGIPDELIGRIFEPYFTTKEEGKGMGMGLYLCKMIIEQNMQGRISVENHAAGAYFTIDLSSSRVS